MNSSEPEGRHRSSPTMRKSLPSSLWIGLSLFLLVSAAFFAGVFVGLRSAYSGSEGANPAVVAPVAAAVAVMAVIAAVPAFAIAYRSCVTPVRRVAERLGALVAGKETAQIGIPSGAPRVIRNLAERTKAFLQYLDADLRNLRAATTKFAVFSQDIASSSEKLSDSSEIQVHEMIDVSRTLARFNETLQSINRQIETQVTTIDETSSAIDDLTAGMKSIVSTSTDIEFQVAETVRSVETGHERIAGSLEQSTEMDEVVSLLAEKMDRLSRHSSQISTIVQVIQDISERTHVLATNASIQAAKAGDAGRGFAVVADQIRELSQGTSTSVAEIDQLMSDTVAGITEAMAETQRVRSFTQDFQRTAGESRSALQSITQEIEKITAMVAAITKEVRSQERATDQVRMNAESLLEFSGTVKKETAEQADRSRQIISVIDLACTNSEKYAQASKALSQLGKYLTVGVDALKRISARYALDTGQSVITSRRAAPRVKNVYSLEVVDGTLRHEIGHLDDVSATGLRILTKKTLQKEQTLDIAILPSRVTTQEQEPCALRVEIRWVEEASHGDYRHAGCKIVNATPANRERLARLIEQAERMQRDGVSQSSEPNKETEPFEEELEVLEELDD